MQVTTLILFLIFANCNTYKPVVLLHGIMTYNTSMELLKQRIEEKHPGTIIYNTNRYSGWSSLENMWSQAQNLANDLMNITKKHPEGIHFLGYSQGALLARSIIQVFPEHNVQNFISLSGPQAGQYGTSFLHIIFPGLALKSAFELFYSRIGQHTSVGNYWNDPHHQALYYNFSEFLPYINNEVLSKESSRFKAGLVKLKKLVLIGGPQDNVITPWESAHFGYYNANETVIPMKERSIYIDDKIGLKTLDDLGRLIILEVPGINHFMWHRNITMFDECILPYLD